MADKLSSFFNLLLGGMKRVGAASVDPLCKLIASLGMMAMVMIGTFSVMATIQAQWLGLILTAIAFPAGFILQGLILAIAGHKNTDDGSYEGARRYIIMKYFLPMLALAAVAAAVSGDFFFEYFRQLMLAGKLAMFDQYSLQPFVCSAVLFAAITAGAAVQFYPYSRLANERVMVTCLGIGTLFWVFTSGTPVVGILFAVYAGCSILIMNQSYIMRTYRALTVTKITTEARLYSFRMVLLALVLTVIGGVIVFIVLNGLWRVILFLFYLTIYTFINSRTGTAKRETESVSTIVFGDDTAVQVSNQFSLVGAIIFVGGLILIVIFGRTVLVREILDFFKRLFDDFIALFMGSESYERETEINYKDTIEQIDKVKRSRMQNAIERGTGLTLRGFNSEMNALANDSERLSYSYIVMIMLLSNLGGSLKRSDTPRELADKIESSMEFPAIDEITDTIEQIKYAETSVDPDEIRRVLTNVRTMVEKHLV